MFPFKSSGRSGRWSPCSGSRRGRGLLDDAAQGVAHLAADDDGVGPAPDLPAGERAVAALGAELGGIDGPAGAGVDQGDVGLGPRPQGPLGNAQELGRG